MRPATYYYLTQMWPSTADRPAEPGTLPGSVSRGRHVGAHRRAHPARGLPAVVRRVVAALSGTWQAAKRGTVPGQGASV